MKILRFWGFSVLKKVTRRPRTKRGIAIRVLIAFLLTGSIFLFVVSRAQGVTRTWDGECGVDTSWSCDNNWSGNTEPGASDLALFDTFDGDATVDVTYAGSVGGVQITANYDGTITQSRSLTVGSQNFNQAGGNWSGGSQTFDINDGSFTISGGVHTATTGTWTLERDLTKSGGTLTMTGATVTFDGAVSNDDSTVTCSGSLGGSVVISKTQDGDFTNSSGCTITVTSVTSPSGTMGVLTNNGTFNHTGSTFNLDNNFGAAGTGGTLVNSNGATMTYSGSAISIEGYFTQNGTFDLSGITVTIDGANEWDDSTITCSGSLGGSIVISKTGGGDFTNSSGCTITVTSVNSSFMGNLTNSGTFNHTGSTFNLDDGSSGNAVLLNDTGATMTYSGSSITLESSFTQSGTFDLTGITVTFDGANNWHDSTVTCTGSLGGSVTVTKTGGGDFTNSSGCTITVTSVNSSFMGDFTNNGTLNHTGSTFNLDDGGAGNAVLLNNTGATMTYSGSSITLESSFTQSGTFNLSGITITFDGSQPHHDSTVTCTGALGGTVVISKTGSGDFTNASGCTITVTSASLNGGDLTNNGTFNHTGTTFNLEDGSTGDVGLINSPGATMTYSGTSITIEGIFTQSGTFDLTGITVSFDGSQPHHDSILTCTGTFPGSITLAKTGDGDFTLSTGCTAIIDSTSTATNVGDVTVNGTGNLTINNGSSDNLPMGNASGNDLTINGTLTVGANVTLNIDDGSVDNNGTLNLDGNIELERNFDSTGGTVSGSGIVTLNGGNGDDSTVTCSGSLGGTFNMAKAISSTNASVIIVTNCTVTVGSINNTEMGGGTVTINGTMNHTGSTFNIDGGNLTVSSTGTVTYSGTNITIERNLTQNGTWDLSGKTITLDGANNDHSTVTCSNLGGTLNMAKAASSTDNSVTIAAGCTVTVGSINNTEMGFGSVTINGTMNHTGSTFNIDSGNLIVSATGTVTYSGTNITIEQNLTQNGTWDLTGKTITLDGENGDDSTVSCSNLGGTLNMAKAISSTNASVTIAAGCTVTVGSINNTEMGFGTVTINGTMNHTGSTFNIDSGNLVVSATGIVTYSGTNINVEHNFTQNGTWDLSGKTVTLDGAHSSDDSILTCGSSSGFNLVINKSDNGGTTVLGGNCTVNDFTRTDGPINNPSSPYILTVQGNFSTSTTDLFGGNRLTLVFGGSATTQTITQNAGGINANMQVNKSTGTASLSTNLLVNGTATVSAGTIDLNSRNFTAGQGFSVQDGATLELYGSETTTAPTLNTGSIVKYTGDGGSDIDGYTLKDYAYYHLTIASVDSGDTFATPNATEDVDGNFTLSGGVFTAPTTLTVGGNFAHTGGTFTQGSGTVTFDTASLVSAISGNTTFNSLTSNTAGKRITIANGSTQTVNNFTLTGTSGNRIKLTGVSGSTQWNLVAATPNVSFVEARDSNACGGTSVSAISSIDLGNNSCWTTFSGSSNPSDVRIQRGVNIRRGTTIRRN